MRIDWSFVKGSAVVGVGNVVAHVLNMIFFVIIARIYTKTEYGYIRYIIIIATLASVTMAGISRAFTIYLGKYKDEKNLRDIYFSNTIVAIFFLSICITMILLVINKLSFGTFLVMIGLTVFAFYFEVLRGFILPKRITTFRVGTNITEIIMVIFFIFIVNSCPPLLVLGIFGFSCLVPMFIMEIFEPLPLSFKRIYISRGKLRELFLLAGPLILSAITYTLMVSVDIILIESFLGMEEVGIYSVARTITIIFSFAPMAIGTILMPKVAGMKQKGKVRHYMKFSLICVVAVSFALLMFIHVFGGQIIGVLFTQKYLEAISPLYLLSYGMFFYSIYYILSNVWTGIGKPFIPSVVILGATGVNIVGNIYFIPRLGIMGAGLIFMLTYILAVIILGIITLKTKW